MRLIGTLLIMLAGVQPALAHGPSAWIGDNHLANSAGQQCCGEHDCHIVPREAVVEIKGGYSVDYEGIPYPVAYADTRPSYDEFVHVCIWGGGAKCLFIPVEG